MRELIDFSYLDSGKDPLSDVRHSHGKSYEIIFVKNGNGIFVVNDKVLPLEMFPNGKPVARIPILYCFCRLRAFFRLHSTSFSVVRMTMNKAKRALKPKFKKNKKLAVAPKRGATANFFKPW